MKNTFKKITSFLFMLYCGELGSDNIKLRNCAKCSDFLFFPLRILEVYLSVGNLPSAFRHVVGVTGKKLLKPPKM